jgi:hypothetical protein
VAVKDITIRDPFFAKNSIPPRFSQLSLVVPFLLIITYEFEVVGNGSGCPLGPENIDWSEKTVNSGHPAL